MDKGYLIVQTSTTETIFPVSDSTVIVNGDGIDYTYETDRSGKTPKIEIITPDTKNSTEQTAEKGYTSVEVSIFKEGYYKTTVKNVQIFPKETSLLYVNMIPLPENEPEKGLVYDTNSQNL